MVVKMFGCCMAVKVLEEMDRLRGDIPRSRYIQRLVEKTLKEHD
jgi:hypothetical protein